MITKDNVKNYINKVVEARKAMILDIKVALSRYADAITKVSIECAATVLEKNYCDVSNLYTIEVPEEVFKFLDEYESKQTFSADPRFVTKSVTVDGIRLEAIVFEDGATE